MPFFIIFLAKERIRDSAKINITFLEQERSGFPEIFTIQGPIRNSPSFKSFLSN